MPPIFVHNPCHFNVVFLFYCSHCYLFLFSFLFPWKSQATAEAIKWKQDCICQVSTVTRNLHNDALTASYSYALALLFSISASGWCTNQIHSKIFEGFFFFSQQPKYQDRELTLSCFNGIDLASCLGTNVGWKYKNLHKNEIDID